MNRMMTLVAFLQAQNCSNLPGSWRHPSSMTDFLTPEYYQRIARTLTPAGERAYSEQRLATYEAGEAYVDRVPRPIGGDADDNEDTDTATLWREAEALMGVPRPSLH